MYEGLYDDFLIYMRGKRIYVSDNLKRELGKSNWLDLLREFVGYFTIHRQKGIAIDSLYGEMESLFPYLLSNDIENQCDQLLHTIDILRIARLESKKTSL